MVHTNFGGNSYGPIIGPYLFLGKFVWTNGPESSSKVPRTLVCMDGYSQQNPGFRKRKTPSFHESPPTPSPPPKNPFKIPKDPPLLVWECMGVHSTMERSAGASFGGAGWRVWVAIYETHGFLTQGFAVSDLLSSTSKSGCPRIW